MAAESSQVLPWTSILSHLVKCLDVYGSLFGQKKFYNLQRRDTFRKGFSTSFWLLSFSSCPCPGGNFIKYFTIVIYSPNKISWFALKTGAAKAYKGRMLQTRNKAGATKAPFLML